jgi:hypothetical protein
MKENPANRTEGTRGHKNQHDAYPLPHGRIIARREWENEILMERYTPFAERKLGELTST